MAEKNTKKIDDKFDFNQGLEELETIVRKMEAGDLSLDESLKNFEAGIKLSRKCNTALNDAQQKITTLTAENGYQEN
jgi:exodeoxyribonuclease VII small subunit